MLKHKQLLAGLFIASLLAGCAGMMGGEKYQPLVVEQKSIPEVSVRVSHQADGIYRVQVHNKTNDTISLQWSNSAYVNTGGDTVRLINIPDPDNFPEGVPAQQESSVILRNARLTTWFVGESWIDFARRGVMPRPRDSESKAGIYLGFDIKGKKVYWKGEVSFAPLQ